MTRLRTRFLGIAVIACVLSTWLVISDSHAAAPGRPRAATRKDAGQQSTPASGPLYVHPSNPRYFTDGSGKAIYLTGSHIHNNLIDHSDKAKLTYTAYLDFLQAYHHNFMRMWTWEHIVVPRPGSDRLEFSPLPYQRTGPGHALDGKPKFDLTAFNPVYFTRLRQRVAAARDRGIYVSVMLFEGWSMWGYDRKVGRHASFKAWDGHPYHPANNIHKIEPDVNGDGLGEEIHTLRLPAVTRLQEAYVRHVIDTLNDLDNVLYEIANESAASSTEWQYHLIRFIKQYEATKPNQHPVGMTFQWAPDGRAGKNSSLFDSPADWISPNPDGGYKENPPASHGHKVIITDTDHLWGLGGDQQWVWKSFLRGLNPIFMDIEWSPKLRQTRNGLGQPSVNLFPAQEVDAAVVSGDAWEPVRRSMGYTRKYANKMNLAAATPQNALASTHYCLANPGTEYLVYLPHGGMVTVDLRAASGTFTSEWFNPTTGETIPAEVVIGGSMVDFRAPFEGDMVLYLTVDP